MSDKRKSYLIQDPYDEDALEFIRTIFLYFGLRPVCFYTSKKGRYYGERQFPVLKSDLIEARYDVSLAALRPFAEEVGSRYRILAVIPYREDTVEVAAELGELLALDWNSAETVRRFRDKYELKRHVRLQDPGVRVPDCRLVRGESDVWQHPPPARFVIKPNDGFGNRQIGIFAASDRDAVARHLAASPGTTWILEEYIDGPEFHVDGQIRTSGEVTILGVFEYLRARVNDYPTVYRGEHQCRSSHPRFRELGDYARRLLAATGLRRSPFHLELKVDEHGPCLIDLGARFPSEGGGRELSRVHPQRPDAYAVAAHDYLGANDFAIEPLDFDPYDQELTVLVYGISERAELIASLEGLEEIEALPEFVVWIVRPRLGDRTTVTRDLRGAPYIAAFRVRGSEADASRLIDRVHETVRWNERASTARRLEARALRALERAPRKLSWLAHRLGSNGRAQR